jgi:hypothetical protein
MISLSPLRLGGGISFRGKIHCQNELNFPPKRKGVKDLSKASIGEIRRSSRLNQVRRNL